MSYSKVLSKRILELCEERNWSINELAGFSGLPQTTVNNIVIDKYKNPRIVTIHLIAQGFGMSLTEFLDFSEIHALTNEELQKIRTASSQ